MRISDWSSDVCSSDLVTEAAHLTELQPRKKRIGIEDHSLLAVREVDRDETPRPARALSRADQVAPMQFASDQNILGRKQFARTRIAHLPLKDRCPRFRPALARVEEDRRAIVTQIAGARGRTRVGNKESIKGVTVT